MTRRTITLVLVDSRGRSADAASVQAALRKIPGVIHATGNCATEAVYVAYDADQCNVGEIKSAVRSTMQYVDDWPRDRVHADAAHPAALPSENPALKPVRIR